jgi:hypothetical protein
MAAVAGPEVDGGTEEDVEVWGADAPCVKEVPAWGQWRWRRGPDTAAAAAATTTGSRRRR